MITMLKHDTGPTNGCFSGVARRHAPRPQTPSEDIQELFAEALALGRKVGCIQRAYGGDTYFTYSPENFTQVEMQLLVALSVPPTEVHVALTSGGCRS